MTTYNVYRRNTVVDTPVAIATGLTSKGYSDTTATKGNTYLYSVGAVKNGIEKISDEISKLAGNLWSPSNLTTAAKVWLDETTIVSSGGVATNWNNLNTGANINFSQSNASYRPSIILNAINGKEAIRFDGIDDYLIASTTEAGALFRNVNGAFILCVLKKISTPVSLRWVFSAAISTGDGVRVSTRFETDGRFSSGTRRLDTDSGSVIYDTINTNEYLISGVNINYTGNTQSIYKNATLSSSGSISTSGGNSADSQGYNNRLTIGARTLIDSYANVEIACLIVCSYAMSSAERQKLEGWAAHKYGLTANLPSGHPYKTNPPLQ
jgi:hypothetical protein